MLIDEEFYIYSATEIDFHIYTKNIIYKEVFNFHFDDKIKIFNQKSTPEGISENICFQLMDEIYSIFCTIHNANKIHINDEFIIINDNFSEIVETPISYIKRQIKNITYNFVIEHQNVDQFPYLFIIGYYLYIQVINYKKNDEIRQHCLDADTYIDGHNYENTYIHKIIYILLIFLPPHIYTDDIFIKMIQFYQFINSDNLSINGDDGSIGV